MFSLILSCDTNNSNQYRSEIVTDSNGFSYEAISNDPTGLRLYTLDNGLTVYLSKNIDGVAHQIYKYEWICILPPRVIDDIHVQVVSNEDEAPNEVWHGHENVVECPMKVNQSVKDVRIGE